ncbi:MAG: FecCD family ABC transporter permease [Peptoniphilaceae bacterium]
MGNKFKRRLSYLIVSLLLLILVIFSCKAGSLNVSFLEIAKGLFVEFDPKVATIYDLRFPRIIISILAGAALAVSGVLLQAVMQNPLTDPGIIGISSASSLVATLVVAIFPSLYFTAPIFAIFGGVAAYLILYGLAWDGGANPIKLILVGVALSMIFTGFSEGLKIAIGGNTTSTQAMIAGNIAQKTWDDVNIMKIYGIGCLIISLFLGRMCNLLTLEDKTAKSIGVNVNKDRMLVALVGVALASVATAIVGVVGFLGLLVAHISRIIVGSNHKYLIPFSALLGATIFLGADTLGRTILYPYEISSSIIMTIICGPFFIILLKVGGEKYGG